MTDIIKILRIAFDIMKHNKVCIIFIDVTLIYLLTPLIARDVIPTPSDRPIVTLLMLHCGTIDRL